MAPPGNRSVAKSVDGRKVRARGHVKSQGRHRPEIEQSRRAAMAVESGREGTMIAKNGGDDDIEDGAEAKKADEEEAANFLFFLVNALCAGGRKQG
jgi:hypothetical protein